MFMRHSACVLAVTVSCAIADAGIINVPAQELSIQAGITAATAGDEVVVAPGIYPESIDLLGKAITVRSSGGGA